MDPNPNSYPILSFVMSRLSKLPSFKTAQPANDMDADPEAALAGGPSGRSRDEYVELVERMPRLQQPELLASMAAAISNAAQTRSVLGSLGERPDHETVESARARLAEIDDDLFRQLEEIRAAPCPDGIDPINWRNDREKECRSRLEREKVSQRAIIQLDEMHESYQKLLREAEGKLEKMYEAGGKYGKAASSVEEEEEEEQANEEVIAILQQGSKKCLERVDLSDRRLRHLPEAFGRLRGLISLNLSNNQLSTIPDAISGLECLEELQLSTNNLTSLPDSLGLLLSLKILNVSANKLKSLPDSISKCRSLVELDVSYNELTYLPTNIGFELQRLEKLCIHLNKIRSLPTSVCEMTSLHLLDAHFNELRGLPNAIGKLTNLEILDLSSNFSDLQELPATFGDLHNLRELDLSNNQMRELPDTFGRLDKLLKLNLDQNPLVLPPLEIVSRGVHAVKEYMAKRWVEILLEEERKQMVEETASPQASWLTRSTSWISSMVYGVTEGVTEYLGGSAQNSPTVQNSFRSHKSFKDPYLDQQL